MQPGGAKIMLRYIPRVISTTPAPAPAEKEADTNIYPSALTTYEEVAASPELFMETLEKLHKSIGTKFIGADWKFAADQLVRAFPDNGSHIRFCSL
ncbi:hypothetical protein AAC387_Pa02g3472 [Persea americana]